MHLTPTSRPRLRAVVAAAAVAAVLAGPWAGGAGPASARPSAPPSDHDKLTSQVEATLETRPKADFWVRFTERPDLAAPAATADWAERGGAVVDALRARAEESQAGVVAELDAAGVQYRSYWVTNAVLVRGGDLDLAVRLAAEPGVLQVRHTETFSTGDPVAIDAAQPDDGAAAGRGEPEWGVREVGAPEVWAQGITGRGIVVANVDTGVEALHPALAWSYRGTHPDGTVTNDYNFLDLTGECGDTPCDGDGHGTHTMGTMVGDDGQGNRVGVAPGARWIAANGCATCSDADLLAAGEWILEPTRADGSDPDPAMRPHVVNNSWGTIVPSDSPWFADIIRAWDASGIFSVWSNGNSGGECRTSGAPGSTVEAYSVGSYAQDGSIAGNSSRGPGAEGELKPNVSAPGVQVRSAVPGGGYATFSGTSMAAPHVSGAVALLWSAVPSLVGDIEGTKRLLDGTAHDVTDTTCGGTAADNNVWGEGTIDVPALIASARDLEEVSEGRLTGTVTDEAGAPLTGATVLLDGPRQREVATDDDGAFAVDLATGEYTVTASRYGYADAETSTTVAARGGTVALSLPDAPTDLVSGKVLDSVGRSLDAATVTLSAKGSAPLVSTTEAGAFETGRLAHGTYVVRTTADACVGTDTTLLHVDGPESLETVVENAVDTAGYSCTGGQGGYRSGDTVLIPGDSDWHDDGDKPLVPLDLPFSFPFYGTTYTTAYVSSNGYLTFADGTSSNFSYQTPSLPAPNAAIYAYWSDLHLDDQAAVYTERVTAQDGTPAVVIEWRGVKYGNGSEEARVSFSATLRADGTVTLGYDQVPDDTNLNGQTGTIGIENESGTAALQYGVGSSNLIHSGQRIEFSRPPVTFVRGKITDRNDHRPVVGAKVQVTMGGAPAQPATRTADDGSYRVAVPVGRATVTVEARGYQPASSRIRTARPSVRARTFSPALATGVASVRADDVRLVSRHGRTSHAVLTVRNTGSAPLELASGAMLPVPEPAAPGTADTATGAMGEAQREHEQQRDAAADVTAPSSAAPTPYQGIGLRPAIWLPDPAGVVQARWSTGPDWVQGIGYADGEVWVSQRGVLRVHDRNGHELRRLDVSGVDGWALDLAYDSTTGRMCQLYDPQGIVCFDDDGDAVVTLADDGWASVPWSSLAYDPVRDVFYLASFGRPELITVAGTTHAAPGTLLGVCDATGTMITSLGYNARSGTLWAGHVGREVQALRALDPVDCTVERSVGSSVTWVSGLDVDATGAVWLYDEGTREVQLTDIDDPMFEDVAGLKVTAPKVVAPGRTAVVHVALDGRRADAGRQVLDLALDTGAGRAPLVRVPLVLTVR